MNIQDNVLDLTVRIVTILRKTDPSKAPSYKEAAKLITNASALFQAWMPDDIVRMTLSGVLWKGTELPKLFNWVKALRTELNRQTA
jgi:hypothetical protein